MITQFVLDKIKSFSKYTGKPFLVISGLEDMGFNETAYFVEGFHLQNPSSNLYNNQFVIKRVAKFLNENNSHTDIEFNQHLSKCEPEKIEFPNQSGLSFF